MIEKQKIGEFLIGINAMTEEQCSDVLRRQKEGDLRLFGEIANELGYVDKEAIKKFLHMN